MVQRKTLLGWLDQRAQDRVSDHGRNLGTAMATREDYLPQPSGSIITKKREDDPDALSGMETFAREDDPSPVPETARRLDDPDVLVLLETRARVDDPSDDNLLLAGPTVSSRTTNEPRVNST